MTRDLRERDQGVRGRLKLTLECRRGGHGGDPTMCTRRWPIRMVTYRAFRLLPRAPGGRCRPPWDQSRPGSILAIRAAYLGGRPMRSPRCPLRGLPPARHLARPLDNAPRPIWPGWPVGSLFGALGLGSGGDVIVAPASPLVDQGRRVFVGDAGGRTDGQGPGPQAGQ